MLSSLVHAGLVWHEERRIKRERREHSAQLEAAAADPFHYHRPAMTSYVSQGRQGGSSERTPLLAANRVLGGRGRAGSVA
jgi:hypothetical protein